MIKNTLLVLCIAFVCWGEFVEAGTVTFDFGGTPVTLTTTARQDAALARLLVRDNAVRAGNVPPDAALTVEEYVRQVLLADIQGFRNAGEGVDQKDACTAYQALVLSGQNQIKTALGGHNPCP